MMSPGTALLLLQGSKTVGDRSRNGIPGTVGIPGESGQRGLEEVISNQFSSTGCAWIRRNQVTECSLTVLSY